MSNKSKASWRDGLVPLPSLEFLRSKLNYNPKDGALTWIGRREGKPAGCKQYRDNGEPNAIRVGIEIDGSLRQFVAHRLIFALMEIDVPNGMVIDHRDDDPFNNAMNNLRLASHGENISNQRRQKRRALPKGVWRSARDRVFVSQLRKNGKTVFTGHFQSADEAKRARDAAASLHHGEFAHV